MKVSILFLCNVEGGLEGEYEGISVTISLVRGTGLG